MIAEGAGDEVGAGGVGRGRLGTVCALRHLTAPGRDGIFGRRLPQLRDKAHNFHVGAEEFRALYVICVENVFIKRILTHGLKYVLLCKYKEENNDIRKYPKLKKETLDIFFQAYLLFQILSIYQNCVL